MIVYKATNKLNGKVYIGATSLKLNARIKYHLKDALRNGRSKGYFQEAILKYGIDSFDFEQIDSADTKEEMYKKEQYWINYYHSTDLNHGYNLDSGGINCKKSEFTKRKIGLTSKEKWKDPDISSRMLEGLRKGTVRWKELCEERRIKFVCPQCGIELYLRPYEAKSKKYCSASCAKEAGAYKNATLIASEKAAIINHERNLDNKAKIAERIIEWAFDNRQYVMNCKFNDITNYYRPLLNIIKDEYGISDLRSLFVCFNVSNKREFAKTLMNIVSEENIC